MSIYATLWILKFPSRGDDHTGCGWTEVIAQGVPAHVGTPTPGHGYETGDPYSSFLPPAVPLADPCDFSALRAVVIVRNGAGKRGQEYVDPLLVLTAEEYEAASFDDIHGKICDALRGDRPWRVAECTDADGRIRILFEGGSVEWVTRDPGGDA